MHIAYCSPQWPPAGAANGIVSYVAAMRSHFLQKGHQVSVIAGERLYDASGTVRPLLPPATQAPTLSSRVTRRMDDWRGDLPHVGRSIAAQIRQARRIAGIDIVEMEESFGWCGIADAEAGVPIVTRLHGPHFLKPPQPLTPRERFSGWRRTLAEGKALRSVGSITSPSRSILESTTARYDIPGGLRTVIPNPIALAAPEHRWRASECEANRILFVGRFDYWKGADTMLTAFDRLVAMRPDARLTFVGPDTGIRSGSRELLGFHAWVCANLSPEARARIDFMGMLPPDRIVPLRRQAAVTVATSRCENFPYALLEGLATASPLISTDWSGATEIIEHGVSGMLTPVGQAEPLAVLLEQMLDDPDFTAGIAAGGFERCRARFSGDVVGAAMLNHYQATLEASAS